MSNGRQDHAITIEPAHVDSPRSRSPSGSFSEMPRTPPRSTSPPPLSQMPTQPPRSTTQASTDPSRPLLAPTQVQTPSMGSRALSAMQTVSKVVSPLSDMGGAALSIADVANSTTNHPYVRGALSGGLWAASGALSLAANYGASTVRQVATDSLNIAAGGFSMLATGASAMGDSQAAHTATSAMSYASNASWIAAGAGAMYQGWRTAREANTTGWKKLSGGLQFASGAFNAGAGIAGIAATALTETDEHVNQAVSPSYAATALSFTSGALWATGSVLGGLSAWAGSGSASQPAVRQTNGTIQNV